jgi:non-heme chloroperoxidase
LPTLIIHGDHDQSAPLELTARKIAELVPGSELRIYEGAPHGLILTHADRLESDLAAGLDFEKPRVAQRSGE